MNILKLYKRFLSLFKRRKFHTGRDYKVLIDGIPLELFKGSVEYKMQPIDVLGKFEVSELEPEIVVKHS